MISILLILCGSWFDVDDVVEPVKPVDPPIPPVAVCACGCGKTGCMCGKVAAVSGCAVVEAKPVLSIDDSALNAVATQSRRRYVVTVYSPVGWKCPPCESMKQFAERDGWKAGDADIEMRWVSQNVPVATAYPWIVCEDRIITGYRNIEGLRTWLKLPAVKPAMAPGAVNVGTINGKALREFQASIPADGVIQFGGAKIAIPKPMATQIEVAPERQAVKFTGTKPRLSYGSGWLSVSQPINGIVVTRDLLTIGLDGFPDLTLRVE